VKKASLLYCLLITGILLLHIGYFALNYARGDYSLGVDGERYKTLATEYAESETLLGEKCTTLFWTPWFVYLALLGRHPVAVFVFNLLCFATVLFLLGRLSDLARLASIWRFLLVLGYGLYWPTFDYCLFYHYEMFLTLILVGAVFFTARYRPWLSKSVAPWIVLGSIVGLGVFAHSKAIGAFLWGALFLIWLRKEIPGWRPKLTAFALASLALLFLWGARNKIVADQWVFSSNSIGYNLYVGHNPVAQGTFSPQPPYPPQDQALGMALDYITAHPGRSLYLTGLKTVKFWLPSKPEAFGPKPFVFQEWLILPWALLGLLMAVRSRERPLALTGPAFMILYYILFHAVFYLSLPRFRLPVMPFLCLFAVYGFAHVVRGKSKTFVYLLCLLSFALLSHLFYLYLNYRGGDIKTQNEEMAGAVGCSHLTTELQFLSVFLRGGGHNQ
jgi:hypothetical protein